MYILHKQLSYLPKRKVIAHFLGGRNPSGGPTWSLPFSVAFQQSLSDLQLTNPEVSCLAYLDDIFIMGPPDKVFSAFVDLKSAFNPLELEIQDKKCEVFCPSLAPSQFGVIFQFPCWYESTRDSDCFS